MDVKSRAYSVQTAGFYCAMQFEASKSTAFLTSPRSLKKSSGAFVHQRRSLHRLDKMRSLLAPTLDKG